MSKRKLISNEGYQHENNYNNNEGEYWEEEAKFPAMSYRTAADVLWGVQQARGSVKSLIFAHPLDLKQKKVLFAICCETLKRKSLLEKILGQSPRSCYEDNLVVENQWLAWILIYESLFSGKKPGPRVSRNLGDAECSTWVSTYWEDWVAIEEKISPQNECKDAFSSGSHLPKYALVNSLVSSMKTVKSTLKGVGFERVSANSLEQVDSLDKGQFSKDYHVKNVLTFSPKATSQIPISLITSKSILFMDKASCITAASLVGGTSGQCFDADKDLILDACCAPGMKTIALANLIRKKCADRSSPAILAFDRDEVRVKACRALLANASADSLVKLEQGDFLSSEGDPNVTHILLDPSCSGTGMLRDVGRQVEKNEADGNNNGSRKRKKVEDCKSVESEAFCPQEGTLAVEWTPEEASLISSEYKNARYVKLAHFQAQMLSRALSAEHFPNARRVVYSTCSTTRVENELVVRTVLERYHGVWRLEPTPFVDSVLPLPLGLPLFKGAEHCARLSPETTRTLGFFLSVFVRE